MAHWTDYTTRGWLAFLSFMHVGTAFRCFTDRDFLRTKIFTSTTYKNDITFDHLFGIYSIINAIILIQSSIYLYVYPVTRLVICAILAYVSLFTVESFVYKTIQIQQTTLFPFAFSGLALVWIITFHYIWKPWQNSGDLVEVEKDAYIKFGLPIKKPISKKILKQK
ncbi:uncharacterized protein LOC107361845 [Tetranychus urticae]|uniref:Uncharacterized protein n=1 Tax=Tetranychus urticae TaxID=32264 RepID=T1K867_TETUR|nr:uncharacterized protein LOC107361845 [Tetranychus urticae]